MDGGGIRITDQPIQRSGVQVYLNQDGTERREWRPPAEVQRADSIARLRGAPLTRGHHGIVTSSNWSSKQIVGHVGDNARPGPDGTVIGDIVIHDESAIQDALADRVGAVSMGYTLDLERVSGHTASGERYDAIQRNIRPNHVALVKRGRAGQIVRLRLDGSEEPGDDITCATIGGEGDRVNLEEQVKDLTARMQRLEGANAELKERADSAETALRTAKEQHAKEIAELPARARARARILEQAKAHGVEVREDQSDEDVQRAVCAKLTPKTDLKDRDAAFVAGAFESAISREQVRQDADPRTVLSASGTKTQVREDEDRPRQASWREKRAQRAREARGEEKSK